MITDIWSMTGNIAAVLTTISFLPQAIKVIRTRDTYSISLPMYIIFVLGIFLWILYGFATSQPSILLGNLVTFIFAGIILVYKIKGTIDRKSL